MQRLLRRAAWILVILTGLFCLNLANGNLQESYQDMLIQAGIAVTLAVSLNIVNGFTGQFSIGHAGFMAVGAYVGGAIGYLTWTPAKDAIAKAHPNWGSDQVLASFAASHWWVLPVAMLAGGAVAALFGYVV